MTDRLYYLDSYLRSFEAQILSTQPRGKAFAVVLDRTAFYAEGGGQLYDLGVLSDGQTAAQVLNVQDESGQIVHLLDCPLAGTRVSGEINWSRRFDLTQQHTGQHILSQAFYQLFKAETVSVHMTENTCTLDLARHLNADQHEQVEELANRIAQENRPVIAVFVGDEELARMPLRKPPADKHEKIRIVEIKDFDWSACGGTHVRATGEVGAVKIIRAERRGGEQRIEFMCGMRAVRDYRWKNQSLLSLAAQFTVKDNELSAKIQSIAEENKETRRQLNFARAQLVAYEADRLWNDAGSDGAFRLISKTFTDRPLDEARQLALRLKEKQATVVLFAVAGEKPNLIFARSADLPGDMGKLLREVSAAFGGRGGGQPEMAQGGVANGSDLAGVLQMAIEKIRTG